MLFKTGNLSLNNFSIDSFVVKLDFVEDFNDFIELECIEGVKLFSY